MRLPVKPQLDAGDLSEVFPNCARLESRRLSAENAPYPREQSAKLPRGALPESVCTVIV